MQRGRPRSPDRWGGSPQGAGRSMSRSRSRSRSPRGGAGGGRYMGGRGRGGGSGYRGPANARHNGATGTYASGDTQSDDSGSSSSSGDSAERGPRRGGMAGGRGGGGGRAPVADGIVGPSRREGELLGRVSVLEVELAAEREAHEADRKKLAFVSDKVRAVAERSKNRGTMLVRLVAALRRVDGARAGVEAAQAELSRAQEDLSTMVQQATTMMEGEEAAFAVKAEASVQPQQAAPAERPGAGQTGQTTSGAGGAAGPPPPPPSDPPPGQAGAVSGGRPQGQDGAPDDAGGGGAGGGWSDAGVAGVGADGRPKALSFKLKIPTNV